jgi:hypothetical protein
MGKMVVGFLATAMLAFQTAQANTEVTCFGMSEGSSEGESDVSAIKLARVLNEKCDVTKPFSFSPATITIYQVPPELKNRYGSSWTSKQMVCCAPKVSKK